MMPNSSIEKTYTLAEHWFLNSFNDKGIFNYLYDPHRDEYSTKNNAIRQLMASRLLAELSQSDESLRPLHRRNMDFIYQHWVKKQDGLSFVLLYGKSKLGANAMLLRTLVASPFYSEYRERAESMKQTILRSMNQDGSMMPFLVEPDVAFDADYMLTFYSGEALVALLEFYAHEEDAALLRMIEFSQSHYIDRYINQMAANYYPSYVPWHSISLNLLYKMTGKPVYAKSVFALNSKLLQMQDKTDHKGRFFNPETPQYGSPHASSDGVYCEGLAYALETAILAQDKRRMAEYLDALRIGFSHLASLQYTERNSQFLKNSKRAMGGFRLRRTAADSPFDERTGSNIRIDSVQHSMDAMRKFFQIISEGWLSSVDES